MEEQQGKVCIKCGMWKLLKEYHKNKNTKDGKSSYCKECQKEYDKQKWLKKNPKEIREGMKKCTKCGKWKLLEEYHKAKKGKYGRQSKCKECEKEYKKQWEESNPEYHKRYYKDNSEHYKKYRKQHYQNNAEYCKEYSKQRYQNNKEHEKERSKQRYQNNKDNNLQYISNIVKRISPTFKELNLPIYGYIYIFTNIKTGHVYVGQTTTPLKHRYGKDITKGWIKEREHYKNQKFKNELIEEDFVLTELFDIGYCKYHLDKLEAYWINHYDSCDNGYNNCVGNHDTNDGLEEFIAFLERYNLEFIDGQIAKKIK